MVRIVAIGLPDMQVRPALTDQDFKAIVEEGWRNPLPSERDLTQKGETFAAVIDRCGIATFTFDRESGRFHALAANGDTLASARSIRGLLESL